MVFFCVFWNTLMPWVVCIRGSFTSKWYQIYPTIFWSGLPETVPQIGGRQKSNVWSLLEPELGVSLRRGGVAVCTACTLAVALKCFHWTWEDDDDGTSRSRCEPRVRRAECYRSHVALLPVCSPSWSINGINRLHTSGDLTPATDNGLSFEL